MLPGREPRFACEHCEFYSVYLSLLLAHLELHSKAKPDSIQAKLAAIKLYTCNFCGTEFNRKSRYKSHILACKPGLPAAPSVQCDVCSKLFKSEDSLAIHTARDHEGSKTPWTCSICDKGFTRKASYEEHIARHKGIKDKHCAICNKYFYETAFWRHNKLVHPTRETLRFTCHLCQKQFPQKFKLKQHLSVHLKDDEKKLMCEVELCGKRFASRDRLKSHVAAVHNDKLNHGALVCGECGATYK